MSYPQKHIINQLSAELAVSSEQEAFGFRKTLEEMLQTEVSDVIDKLCSQYVAENKTLKIDHLTIDLGEISGHDFKENWLNNFKQTFENQLLSIVQKQEFQTENPVKILSDFELLTHFLSTGQLPWWVVAEDVNFDNLIDNIIQNEAFALRDFLIKHKNNKHLIQRIFFQFSTKQILDFIENVQICYTGYELIFEEIRHKIKSSSLRLDLIENQENITLEAFLRTLFKYDFQEINDSQIIHTLLVLWTENNLIDFSEIKVLSLDLLPDLDLNEIQNNDDESTILGEEIKKINIQNAGVVLINPFLKPFFQELQLLENDIFVNKKAQYKAIHLIKHLATGDTVFSEFDLSLEKLICGIPLNEPVPRKVNFTERELYEAKDLLESVIGHWQVLKNSSVQALRSTFFQREGILRASENGWQINIERKTQDILLDSLPWSFSMMLSSWNNYIISVEW